MTWTLGPIRHFLRRCRVPSWVAMCHVSHHRDRDDIPVADPPPTWARPAAPRHQRRPFRVPALHSARVVAIAAVVVLAIATGPWALWLLWPALVLTGGCGFGSRHAAGARFHARPAAERPPVVTRL